MTTSSLMDRLAASGQQNRPAWQVARPSSVPETPRSTEVLSPWVRRNLNGTQHAHPTAR